MGFVEKSTIQKIQRCYNLTNMAIKWWGLPVFFILGLLAAGVILLLASPPRGEAVLLDPPPAPPPLLVQVAGAVNQPGTYSLPRGSRVQDALAAASGARPDSNPGDLNQAAFLVDGQRIFLPAWTPTPLPTPVHAAPTATLAPPSPDNPLNINTASLAELDTLPGIGQAKAQAILDYRQANGLFMKKEDLILVPGIGPGLFEQLKDLVTITVTTP